MSRRTAHSTLAIALLGFGSLLVSPAGLGGTIYEWTLNGQKYATDRPPPPGAKVIRVTQGRAGATAPAQRPATAAASANTATGPASDDAARTVAQDLAKVQTDQCAEARERYNTYLQAQRLFKPGPNNERQYLTDAELAEARVNAKRAMDTACAAR